MQAATLLTSAVLLVVLDQFSKALVVRTFLDGRVVSFGLVAIRNKLNRAAFRGPLGNRRALLALMIAETAVLAVVVQFAPIFDQRLAAVALGVAIGGAASNALDQAFRQGVVDFIDLGFWPIFNFADIAIVVGIVTALICI